MVKDGDKWKGGFNKECVNNGNEESNIEIEVEENRETGGNFGE